MSFPETEVHHQPQVVEYRIQILLIGHCVMCGCIRDQVKKDIQIKGGTLKFSGFNFIKQCYLLMSSKTQRKSLSCQSTEVSE